VVEYCMRGSLYEVMSEETFNLTWERSLRVLFLILHFILPDEHLLTRFLVLSLVQWAKELAMAINYLHKCVSRRPACSQLCPLPFLVANRWRLQVRSAGVPSRPQEPQPPGTRSSNLIDGRNLCIAAAQSANTQRALLSRQLDNDWTIKVCDFGASRLDTPTETVTLGKMRYIHRIPLALDAAGSSTHCSLCFSSM
jgi:hypothetical protein